MCEICRMMYDMMKDDGESGFFDDDGNRYEPADILSPVLCNTCSKDGDPGEYICCMLNRLDFMLDPPEGGQFICDAFLPSMEHPPARN